VRNTTLLPEKGRTPENLWRFFFSVEEKSEISLGFRVHLSLIRRGILPQKSSNIREGQRERERDFARETERER